MLLRSQNGRSIRRRMDASIGMWIRISSQDDLLLTISGIMTIQSRAFGTCPANCARFWRMDPQSQLGLRTLTLWYCCVPSNKRSKSGIVAGPLTTYQPYQHDHSNDEPREASKGGTTVYATDSREYDSQYTQADAEAAFQKLLKKAGVSHDWTWERAMRAIIKEPQYRAIKDPKDRRAAFEKYTSDLRIQEIEKAKDRIAKLRTDFTTMLKSHPEIKYYTRWKTALQIIQGETIFRSASDDVERRQLFEEYIADLRKAEQERENAARREAINDLAQHLKSLNLEPYTRWSEAQAVLEQDEYFNAEEKFRVLSKLDILNAFESHIKVLERTFNDQKQRTKSLKQRKERKNREAFWALLQELRKKGHINPKTKWMDIHPLIKDDEKYTNMLGQPGSTPLDYFWDMMEEVDREVRHKRNVAFDVLDVSSPSIFGLTGLTLRRRNDMKSKRALRLRSLPTSCKLTAVLLNLTVIL